MDNEDRAQSALKLAEALEMLAARLNQKHEPNIEYVYRGRMPCGDVYRLDREPPAVCPYCEGRRRDWDALTPAERHGLVDPYGDVSAEAVAA